MGTLEIIKGINVASTVCSLIVILIILIILSIDKVLADRVSIRFTLAISTIDCLRSAVIIFLLRNEVSGGWCTFVSFSSHWLTLMYLFLTVAIALNLQLVILRGLRFQPIWELYYWIAALFAATILLIFPLAFGMFGKSTPSEFCEFKDALSYETFVWRMASYLLWVILACVYCAVIVIKVVLQLRKKVTVLNQVDGNLRLPLGAEECANLMRSLKRLIRRISLYCLLPIISQVGFVILVLHRRFSDKDPKWLLIFSMSGLASPGVLNFIAFMLDPALYVAVTTLRRHRCAYTEVGRDPSPAKQAQDPTPISTIVEIAEPCLSANLPPISAITAGICTPASPLAHTRWNNPSLRHIVSMPPRLRPATMASRIMSSMSKSQRSSLGLSMVDEPLYSQLDNRLSTFIQGL